MSNSEHGKAYHIQASETFKQSGNVTGHTEVMNKCST